MDPDNSEAVEERYSGNRVVLSNLPLLFVRGLPTSLEQMSLSELEVFVPFMTKCSLGENLNTPWSQLPRPSWWPIRLPYRLPSKQTPSSTRNILMQLINSCYACHGCNFLLEFCSRLKQMPPTCGYRFNDNHDGTTSMFHGDTGKLLVTFRNENREYDNIQKSKNQVPSQRKLLSSRNCNRTGSSVQHSSTKNRAGGRNMIVQPPVIDVYLCDKCDNEFQSLKEVQSHEKTCKGFNPSSLSLPSPEPEEPEEDLDHSNQVPFLSYFGLAPEHHTGYTPYVSPKKRSAAPKFKRSLSQNYLQFDSIDICSPLGRYILSHCKHGGRLQIPEYFVSKYEKFIYAHPDSDALLMRDSRTTLNRWTDVWKARRNEQPWSHLYCFNSRERRERDRTIRTAGLHTGGLPHSPNMREIEGNERFPSKLKVDGQVSIKLNSLNCICKHRDYDGCSSPRLPEISQKTDSEDSFSSNLKIDEEVFIKLGPLDSPYSHRDYFNNHSSYGENLKYRKIVRSINDITSDVNNGFTYLKNPISSSINAESGANCNECDLRKDIISKDFRRHNSFYSDHEDSSGEQLTKVNGIRLRKVSTKVNREINRLLNDECRELKRKGLSFLNRLNSKKHKKLTRLVAGKVLEDWQKIRRCSDVDINQNSFDCRNFSQENVKMSFNDSGDTAQLRGVASPLKVPNLHTKKSYLLESSTKENIVNMHSIANSLNSNFDINTTNYVSFMKKRNDLEMNEPKKPKLSRELRNITMDECKELKGMGFHPSYILGQSQSLVESDDAHDSTTNLKQRPRKMSLISYKNHLNDYDDFEGMSNGLRDEHKFLDNSSMSFSNSKEKLSKEVTRLMIDEWKELKSCGSHPSQLNDLLSLHRNVRSSFSKFPKSAQDFHSSSLSSFIKSARTQDRSFTTSFVNMTTPRMCHREMLVNDRAAMCVLNYSYDSCGHE